MYSIPDEIQKEFKLLPNAFDSLVASKFQDYKLTKLYSKYNLYEIEPFFAELSNSLVDLNQDLLLASTADFNPETDDLYEYYINFETRGVHFKRLVLGSDSSYETIYEYQEEYYKSTTTFINQEGRKAIKLCYLYFKDELPHWYYECTEYGIIFKAYQKKDDKLTGYQLKTNDNTYSYFVDFIYEGNTIAEIIQKNPSGKQLILYKVGIEHEDKADILKRLEDFLTEQIADQILENVRINEPVYCILLEYSMQHPFPPTVALGLVSELEDEFEKVALWERYNAPDMQCFSEDDSLAVNLFPESIQSEYLYTDKYTEDISWNDEDTYQNWAKEVFTVYMNVCKRLMHFDFSVSFPKSPHFLVMAKEFEQCNEEAFYELLSEYKKKNGF